MENSSSRRFTVTVVLLSVFILIISILLTYVVLTQVLKTDNTGTNNTINNLENDPTENDDDLVTETEMQVKIYLFNQTRFNDAEEDIYNEVLRSSGRADIATFTIEEIINGPTDLELRAHPGIQKTFGTTEDEMYLAGFEGDSNCDGKDFEITDLDGEIATIKFCKDVVTLSDFASGIIFEQFRRTLTQFPTIERVRVLRADGSCFNDSTELTFEQCVR